MKSIIPLSAIAVLAALALVGCDQSSPGDSTGTPSSNSRMSDTNGMMSGATNSMPKMNMQTNSNTTGAANDATH